MMRIMEVLFDLGLAIADWGSRLWGASEVVAAVREIETLVAQGEVGDLLVAHRQGDAEPVVEGGIDDLVAGEGAAAVGEGGMADLAAPAFDERDGDVFGLEGGHAGDDRPGGE